MSCPISVIDCIELWKLGVGDKVTTSLSKISPEPVGDSDAVSTKLEMLIFFEME